MGTWSGRASTTLLVLGLISAAAAFKGKARKTVKLQAAALPEAAAVKGGSGYEANEFAKYEGDSKGKIHIVYRSTHQENDEVIQPEEGDQGQVDGPWVPLPGHGDEIENPNWATRNYKT